MAGKAAWICIIVCFLYGCGSSNDEESSGDYYYPEIQNLLFYGTYDIPLEFTYNVSQPSFAWRATGLKYTVITIFESKIDLQGRDQIANPEEAIWTWNSGMGRGREGNISFSDGRDMNNGEIQETITPLSPGKYYIAAWAYDDQYNLICSSNEYLYEYNP